VGTLFIAEKPSLAEAIALAWAERLNAKAHKSDGCWIVGNDRVTWFFGHMYHLAEPKTYNKKWEKWTIESLPILLGEDEWKLVADDAKAVQLRKIKEMVRSADTIVNCGDSGREGQLLVDEALNEMGIDPFSSRVSRLWVQSMARRDMLNALDSLSPNAKYRHLYDAAVCRQRADWQHGMSFSRLYTVLAQRGNTDAGALSVGRVQTPTLRLVVDRDRERLNFKPVSHFQVQLQFQHENGTFWANWAFPEDLPDIDANGRLLSQKVAEEEARRHTGQTGRVESFVSEKKSKPPPLPYSLSALQADAGRKLGLTAKQVLDVAQALYEKHRAVTYPRTDSRYLPENILQDEAPAIIAALAKTSEFGEMAQLANLKLRSSAWNNAKISDHHGLIPTTEFSAKTLSEMTPVEKGVFSLIAKTFIAQFFPPFQYFGRKAEISCGGAIYVARGAEVIESGWKKIFSDSGEDEESGDEGEDSGDSAQKLPKMQTGDEALPLGEGRVVSRVTSPPPAFTDPLLIAAMANVHRFVSSPEIKKRLKETSGIGTEATRAECIETLLRRGFLLRKGKNGLESSDVGRQLIDVLPENIKSPGMTALWEEGLSKVENAQMTRREFLEAQARSITKQVEEIATSVTSLRLGRDAPPPLPGDGRACRCGVGKMLTRSIRAKSGKVYVVLSCSEYPKCKEIEWPKQAAEVSPLPGDGSPCAKCGAAMRTFVVRKDGPNRGKKFLSCTGSGCKNFVFPKPDVYAENGWDMPRAASSQEQGRTKTPSGRTAQEKSKRKQGGSRRAQRRKSR
jgi:DNA topoisomerase-3